MVLKNAINIHQYYQNVSLKRVSFTFQLKRLKLDFYNYFVEVIHEVSLWATSIKLLSADVIKLARTEGISLHKV